MHTFYPRKLYFLIIIIGLLNTVTLLANSVVDSGLNNNLANFKVTSANSDIIVDGGYSYTSNINYLSFQAAPITNTSASVGVFKFTIRDGGTTPDPDATSTELNSITFAVGNTANIRAAALFGGGSQNALLANTPVINIGANTITFTGLSGANFTAADGATTDLTLRITFVNTVVDNQQLSFTISAATANASGSTFTTANAGGATSSTSGDRNKIVVTATALAFVQQPTNTFLATNTNPAVTLSAIDINSNRDLDFAASVNITSTGTLSTSPNTVIATGGVSTFSTINHTVAGTGLVLSATSVGLTTALSTGFDILAVANNSYRTTSNGNWPTTPTATWELYNGTNWVTTIAPASNTTNLLIIRHSITSSGSFAAPAPGSNMSVDINGIFNAGHNCTFNSLNIFNGGTFSVNDPAVDINTAGILTVEQGGTLILNSNTLNHNDGLFQGTENFKNGSTVIVKQFDNGTTPGNDLVSSTNPIAVNDDGYYFGNLVIDFTNATTDSFTVVGIIGTQKLCQNDLTIANQSTTEQIVLTNVNANVEIGGNVLVTRNKFSFGALSSANVKHTVKGNITVNGFGAIIDLNSTNSGSASVTVDLLGNLIGTAGTFLSTDTSCAYSFIGTTGVQNIDIASTVPYNNCGTIIRALANVQLRNNNLILNASSSMLVESGGMFNFNWNSSNVPLIIARGSSGSNKFTSNAGSILKITSPLGVVKNIAAQGNVQLSISNKTFSQVATFWYTGLTNQVTGDAITTGSSAKNIICDLANNATELSFSDSTSITTPGSLDIRTGKVIETTTAFITGSTSSLKMSDGTYYKIVKGNSTAATSAADVIPRLDGTYTLTGGTIELNNAAASDAFQTVRGARAYFNLLFSGANNLGVNYKNLSSNATINNTLQVAENAIVDCSNGAGTARSFNGPGALVMTGGRIRFLNRSNPQPELTGVNSTYSLTGGVTEFYTNLPGGLQTIKGNDANSNPIVYNQIEVTGSAVGMGSANITLRDAGSFTVKPNGIFEIKDDAIVGPTGTQTVKVEAAGKFKTGDIHGFAGGTGVTATSVRSDIENVILEPGSTVEYSRDSIMVGGEQLITNAGVTSPTPAHYYNLAFSGTGTKRAPASLLSILGNVSKTSAAIFAHNNGTVSFDGTLPATQNYTCVAPTMEFNKIRNNNSTSGLTISDDLGLEDELTLNPNSKLIFGAGNFHIRSNATKTGAVAPLNTSVLIDYNGTGRFVIERFIPAGRKWRFLSVPAITTQSVRQAWMENAANKDDNPKSGYGMIVTDERTNALAQGFDTLSLSGPSMKYHTTGSDYVGITTPADLLNSRQAYMTYVRGDRVCKPANNVLNPTILRTTGQLKRLIADVSGIPIGEFQAIGNPYASRVNLNSIFANSTISPNVYVWDPKLTGSYGLGGFQTLSHNGTGFLIVPGGGSYPVGGPTVYMNEVESGQAFFVRAGGSSGTVKIAETDKLTGSANVFRIVNVNNSLEAPSIRINLSINNANNAFTLIDGVAANFADNATNEVDYTDAKKLVNTSENVAIKRNNNLLSVENRLPITNNDSLPLQLTGTRAAQYQWSINPTNLAADGRTAYLKDNFLRTLIPISLTEPTLVSFATSSGAGAYASDRFVIIFKQIPLPTFVEFDATVANNKSIIASWQVANDFAVNTYHLQHATNGYTFTNIAQLQSRQGNAATEKYTITDGKPADADNYYRVQMTTLSGNMYYSTIAKVNRLNNEVNISLQPNIITDNVMLLQFNNQPVGSYAIKIVDAVGKTMLVKNVHINGYADKLFIAIPNFSNGAYFAIITSVIGASQTLSFQVK